MHEYIHICRTVVPFILTSCSNSCRNMNYSYSTLSCINMLAASTTGAKSFDSKIRFVNLHTGRYITKDWNDCYSSK